MRHRAVGAPQWLEDLIALPGGARQGFHGAHQRRNLAPVRNGIGRVAAVLEGVPVILPFGAPGDSPPCIRQRPFGIAGDWRRLPLLVRAEVLAPALEALFADHRALVAFHGGIVGGDELRRNHAPDFTRTLNGAPTLRSPPNGERLGQSNQSCR
jgi:hypothetical protein